MNDTIRELEEKLLQPDIRKSADELDKLLTDDFMEIGIDGKIYNKQQIIEGLSTSTTNYHDIADFETNELADNLVLATYKVSRTSPTEIGTSFSMRSSIWRKTEQGWQMKFHQGTVIK